MFWLLRWFESNDSSTIWVPFFLSLQRGTSMFLMIPQRIYCFYFQISHFHYHLKAHFGSILEMHYLTLLFVNIRFSNCNGTQTHNHLVRKRTLNHLVKLAKWLSCAVSTCLFGAIDFVFLSYHTRILEWIYTLQLPECHGILCWKQAQYLKVKWLQRNLDSQPFILLMKTQPIKTGFLLQSLNFRVLFQPLNF